MKRLRKNLAVMLVLVMGMALVAGCSRKSKQTMFTVMEDAAAMSHYSYEMDMSLKSTINGIDNVAVAVSGETDGESAVLGIKVSYLYLTVKVDDFITVTRNAMYINVEQLFNALAPMLLGSSFSLEDLEAEFGTELRCIELPLVEGMIKPDGSEKQIKLMISMLEAALKDVEISEEKGVYTLNIEGKEQFADIVDAYLTALVDNKDALLSALNDSASLDEAAVMKLVDVYMDEVAAALESFNAEYELGLTQEDIAELRSEVNAEVEGKLAELDLDDMNSAYDEAFDEISSGKDELVNEIRNSEDMDVKADFTNSLTGKEGSRVYNCNMNFSSENTSTDESIEVEVNSVLTEDNSIAVTAPEKYTSFSGLVYAFLVYSYENDMLEDMLEELE